MGKVWLHVLLLLVGTILLFIMLNFAYPNVMQTGDNQIRIASSLAMVAYLGFMLFNKKTSASIIFKQFSAWVGIFLLVITGYSFKKEIIGLYHQVTSHLLPYKGKIQNGNVNFIKSSNGHFIIETTTNGHNIKYLVDTGASRVVLNKNDALQLGFDPATLTYDQPVSTANGTTFAANIQIKEIQIGPITVKNIPASVSASPMPESLLGMSFLARIKSYAIAGDVLTLSD